MNTLTSKDIEFLANLRVWVEVAPNIIMVHAGIIPGMYKLYFAIFKTSLKSV